MAKYYVYYSYSGTKVFTIYDAKDQSDAREQADQMWDLESADPDDVDVDIREVADIDAE